MVEKTPRKEFGAAGVLSESESAAAPLCTLRLRSACDSAPTLRQPTTTAHGYPGAKQTESTLVWPRNRMPDAEGIRRGGKGYSPCREMSKLKFCPSLFHGALLPALQKCRIPPENSAIWSYSNAAITFPVIGDDPEAFIPAASEMEAAMRPYFLRPANRPHGTAARLLGPISVCVYSPSCSMPTHVGKAEAQSHVELDRGLPPSRCGRYSRRPISRPQRSCSLRPGRPELQT